MRTSAVALLALLSGCGSNQSAEQQVSQMSVAPQPIGYPDIEANELYGASCAYASGRSMAPIVIAFSDVAVMKIDGQIRRFTLDPQCKEVKNGTGSRYLANGHVLDLAVEGEGTRSGGGPVTFNGSVKLSNGAGQILYETTGTAQCGA